MQVHISISYCFFVPNNKNSFTATIILLALSFLTPYFYYIPKATLSAVLITAVIFMVDYEVIPKLWRCNSRCSERNDNLITLFIYLFSEFDLAIALTTFGLCMFWGVEAGLITGIILNMTILLKIWTRPKIESTIYVVLFLLPTPCTIKNSTKYAF